MEGASQPFSFAFFQPHIRRGPQLFSFHGPRWNRQTDRFQDIAGLVVRRMSLEAMRYPVTGVWAVTAKPNHETMPTTPITIAIPLRVMLGLLCQWKSARPAGLIRDFRFITPRATTVRGRANRFKRKPPFTP